MPGTPRLPSFIAAGLLFDREPGPDLMFVIAHALQRRVCVGLLAALTIAIAVGGCVHIALAVPGVGAPMAAPASALLLLKWVGAAYLVWIGAQMLLARNQSNTPVLIAGNEGLISTPSRFGSKNDVWAVLHQGFWTNALNPKVALFFPACMPQFIVPQVTHPSLGFLAPGLLFDFNPLRANAGWALLASWMARRVGAVQRSLRWRERGAGAIPIPFGGRLAPSDGPSAAPT